MGDYDKKFMEERGWSARQRPRGFRTIEGIHIKKYLKKTIPYKKISEK